MTSNSLKKLFFFVWNNKQEYNLTRMNAIYVQQFTQFIMITIPLDPNIKPDLSKLKKNNEIQSSWNVK